MKLSPLDVKKQEFSRSMRGYDVDEVRAFLKNVADHMEDLLTEQAQAQSQLEDQRGKMGHLEHVQEALQQTLETARTNAEETRQAALKKAELIIHEAHLKSEEIVKSAEGDVRRMREEVLRIESQRDELIARLRAALNSQIELLDSYKPPPANRMTETGVETVALGQIDPAAREYAKENAEKNTEKTEDEKKPPVSSQAEKPTLRQLHEVKQTSEETNESSTQEEDDAPEKESDGVRKINVAEVVADLKSSVHDDAEPDDQSDDDGEMQKIRKILDDLD